MRATVIGGRGFVGSQLVKQLISQGVEVIIPEKEDRILFNTDLGTVYYCAGTTSDFRQRPFDTIQAHVTLLAHLLEKATFHKLIYLSSTRVYYHNKMGKEEDIVSVNPLHRDDLFNLSKLTGESLCLMGTHPDVKVVRLSNVCGYQDRSNNFIYSLIDDAVCKGHIELRSSLESEKDYIHIDDAVNLIIQIAERGSRSIYNVASGMNLSNKAIVDMIQQITGCSLNVRDNPEIYKFPLIDISSVVHDFLYKPRSPHVWLQQVITTYITERWPSI